jgi:DNA-binding HxlR family transcriptional regulator
MEDGTFASPGSPRVTVAPTVTVAPGRWSHMAGTPGGCRGREILDRVGDKWSVLVIALLDGQTRRFMDLRRAIPDISQRMLTVTLRHLERDGLVKRTVYPTVPVTVEYTLTNLGTTLLEPVTQLLEWAFAHEAQISAARDEYDRTEPPHPERQ